MTTKLNTLLTIVDKILDNPRSRDTYCSLIRSMPTNDSNEGACKDIKCYNCPFRDADNTEAFKKEIEELNKIQTLLEE